MAKIFLTLAILCVLGAVLVKGFDKKQVVAEFMATMDVCKGEVGAKDNRICYENLLVLVKGFFKKQVVAEFMATMDVCKGEVGAKDTDVEDLISKKPATSMEGKCLRSCMMKKYEMMDNNGKLVKTVAVTHAVKFTDAAEDKIKIINEIADACDAINVPDDHCEAADHYCKCFKEQGAAHGIDKLEF